MRTLLDSASILSVDGWYCNLLDQNPAHHHWKNQGMDTGWAGMTFSFVDSWIKDCGAGCMLLDECTSEEDWANVGLSQVSVTIGIHGCRRRGDAGEKGKGEQRRNVEKGLYELWIWEPARCNSWKMKLLRHAEEPSHLWKYYLLCERPDGPLAAIITEGFGAARLG